MTTEQINYTDSIAALENLSENAQKFVLDMLREGNEAHNRHKATLCHDPDVGDELYPCLLVNENPYPLVEVLSYLDEKMLRKLMLFIIGRGKPGKEASKDELVQWIATHSHGLEHELPPVESFTFVNEFDEAQPAVYEYLSRKYGEL